MCTINGMTFRAPSCISYVKFIKLHLIPVCGPHIRIKKKKKDQIFKFTNRRPTFVFLFSY